MWFLILLLVGTGSAPNCSPAMLGDINGNCRVFFDDFGLFASEWQEHGSVEPSLSQEFVCWYDGTGNEYDVPHAIAIDPLGNVYVAGETTGEISDSDITVLKYYPNGKLAWEANYNGTGNGQDVAWDIAVDNSGNVYVTGESIDQNTSADFVTTKYDSLGNNLWVSRYDGPGHGLDSAFAITLDDSGNVYVTGESDGGETSHDFATVKYDSSGQERWVAIYDRAIGNSHSYDRSVDIAVDGQGNVIVTGSSMKKGGDGTTNDWVTIKYNSEGNMVWVNVYDNASGDLANSLAVDGYGNVFVTGNSYSTTSDCVTIKYASDGNQSWINRFDKGTSSAQSGEIIRLDCFGYVLVGGYSGVTNHKDYLVIKYEPNGSEMWFSEYDGPSSADDEPYSMDVDRDGGVYMTGRSMGYDTWYDFTTVKWDANGQRVWVDRYDSNSPIGNYDQGIALALDKQGNLYTAGASYGLSGTLDFALIKYSFCSNRPFVDLNSDCRVDLLDLDLLASEWIECNLDPPSECWP